nr:glycosyltransferase [Phycisphaerae bacterium]
MGGNWPSERRAPTIEPRRLRVLYLASSLHYGGAERQIVELVRRLDRSRFEPVLCCLDGVDTLARDLNPAAPVLPLKKRHRLDITVVPRLMRLILRQRIDVVHSFLFDAEIAGRLAGRLCGVSA